MRLRCIFLGDFQFYSVYIFGDHICSGFTYIRTFLHRWLGDTWQSCTTGNPLRKYITAACIAESHYSKGTYVNGTHTHTHTHTPGRAIDYPKQLSSQASLVFTYPAINNSLASHRTVPRTQLCRRHAEGAKFYTSVRDEQ